MYSYRQLNDYKSIRPHSSLSDLSWQPQNRNSSIHHHHLHRERKQNLQKKNYRYPLFKQDFYFQPPFLNPNSIRLLQSEQNLSNHKNVKSLNESIEDRLKTRRCKSFSRFYDLLANRSMDQNFPINSEISEWLRFQPLSILQLDPPDRIVLFIAGKLVHFYFPF